MSFFDQADLDKQAAVDKEAADSSKFDPSPGDELQGILTKAELFIGDGRYAPTVVINFRNVGSETVGGIEPGKVGYLFLSTVLRRKMLSAQPAIGTAFKLRYEGQVVPEKGGNPYKDWTIVTESMVDEEDTSKSSPTMWTAIAAGLEPSVPQSRGLTGERTSEGEWKF